MYHPAAGLHQASLADVIRTDFRRLPVFIEQARIMLSPPVEEDIEVVAEAQAAREEVIHEPETAAVLESDLPVAVGVVPEIAEVVAQTADPLPGIVDQSAPADDFVLSEEPAVLTLEAEEPADEAHVQNVEQDVELESAAADAAAARTRDDKGKEFEQLPLF